MEEKPFLLSPEAIIMLSLALFFDLGEVTIELIPGIGQILSIAIDVFAVVFIGAWMYIRSGTVKATKRAAARMGRIAKWAKRMKWIRPLLFFLECIPGPVGALPLWVLVVYFELKT